MEILYVVVPLAIIFATIGVLVFVWSVKSGQYDDMNGTAERVVLDDDDLRS